MLLKLMQLLPRGNPAVVAARLWQCLQPMSHELSLHQRRRKPSEAELQGIPWWPVLLPQERENVLRVLLVGDAEPGDYVCRIGRPPTYWFGVVDGLLKMNTENADGVSMTLAGLPPGAGLAKARSSSASLTATTCRPFANRWSEACPSTCFIGCWTTP